MFTLTPATVSGYTTGGDTVCSGSNAGSIALHNYTGNITAWQSSSDKGQTWNTIPNITAVQAYSNLTVTTWYRAVVQSGDSGSVHIGTAVIVVSQLPSSA